MSRPVVTSLIGISAADETERSAINLALDVFGSEGDEVVEVMRGGDHVVLPPRAVKVLRTVLRAMSSGEELALVHKVDSDEIGSVALAGALDQMLAPAVADMTTQQVADLLNVSRPYVVKLARTGKLPHVMVGNRHRFCTSDVVEYRDAMQADRADALRQLAPDNGYAASDF